MHLPFDDPVLLVLIALTAARITRVITDDDVGWPIRWLGAHTDATHELVSCAWCIGFWISAAVAIMVANFAYHPFMTLFLVIFATSQAVGMLAGLYDEDEDEDDDESEDDS